MHHEIRLSAEAIEDLKRLDPLLRTWVRKAMELYLRHEPAQMSRSRIKRLRELESPQYRLRVGSVRVFYDIDGATVRVHGIVLKSDATRWLEEYGRTS